MKTLKDHTIIYDDECPLCKSYTQAFVATAMLDQQGREPYSTAVGSCATVDWHRAKNEIALINRKQNTVTYGVDALTTIVLHRFPSLRVFTEFKPLLWFLKKLYLFISYNRKVIAPGKVFEGVNTCTPDMNYRYRWMYIVFAWIVTSIILVAYSRLVVPVVPASSFLREFLICGGQIVFQGAIVFAARHERSIHYLGNLMTVSLAGALALAPMFLLAHIVSSPTFYVGYFMVVVSIMFFEHFRRVRILELPWTVCFTWVFYRFVALYFIFYQMLWTKL